jgi:alpha-tubulin suppressor-like RCC1 family protein
MMAVDRFRQLFPWGEGTYGCLGYGDNRRKMMPSPLPFFEGKRIIDVACGDSFTVVIAEV